MHLFSPEEDVATHPHLLDALLRSSTISTGFGGTSREIYDTLSASRGAGAGAGAGAGVGAGVGGGSTSALPPPVLPPALLHFALQLAARVDDMAVAPPSAPPQGGAGGSAPSDASASAAPEPIALLRKSGAGARHGFVFTPTSRLSLLPAVHSCAFQVHEERGFFGGGSAKLVLRALGEQDLREWAFAIGLCLDTIVPVLAS